MTIPLSQRVGRIDLAPNLIATKRAGEWLAQGHDIIILTSGEPDFDTPDFIKQPATAAAYAA
jgi:aspartate aminotransferase